MCHWRYLRAPHAEAPITSAELRKAGPADRRARLQQHRRPQRRAARQEQPVPVAGQATRQARHRQLRHQTLPAAASPPPLSPARAISVPSPLLVSMRSSHRRGRLRSSSHGHKADERNGETSRSPATKTVRTMRSRDQILSADRRHRADFLFGRLWCSQPREQASVISPRRDGLGRMIASPPAGSGWSLRMGLDGPLRGDQVIVMGLRSRIRRPRWPLVSVRM